MIGNSLLLCRDSFAPAFVAHRELANYCCRNVLAIQQANKCRHFSNSFQYLYIYPKTWFCGTETVCTKISLTRGVQLSAILQELSAKIGFRNTFLDIVYFPLSMLFCACYERIVKYVSSKVELSTGNARKHPHSQQA